MSCSVFEIENSEMLTAPGRRQVNGRASERAGRQAGKQVGRQSGHGDRRCESSWLTTVVLHGGYTAVRIEFGT